MEYLYVFRWVHYFCSAICLPYTALFLTFSPHFRRMCFFYKTRRTSSIWLWEKFRMLCMNEIYGLKMKPDRQEMIGKIMSWKTPSLSGCFFFYLVKFCIFYRCIMGVFDTSHITLPSKWNKCWHVFYRCIRAYINVYNIVYFRSCSRSFFKNTLYVKLYASVQVYVVYFFIFF